MNLNGKIKADLIANYLALGVLGVSGLVINIAIASFAGADALGFFNQVFTIYIIVTQFSVFGIQFSLLKYLSQYRAENKSIDELISGAIWGALISSFVVSIILLLFRNKIAGWFDSDGLEQGLLFVIPAIFLFGINKVLLNILNSLREMKQFAAFQALRMILIMLGIVVVISIELSNIWLVVAITVAEIMEFIGLSIVCSRYFKLVGFGTSKIWMHEHFSFGIKGVMNGGVSELNSRVDILIVGIFLSDTAVGIYSMASTVIEGAMQLPAIVRNVVNPIISEIWYSKSRFDLRNFVNKIVIRFYAAFAVVGLLSIPVFIALIQYFVGPSFEESIELYIILMVGLILSAGIMPLDMMPIQLGHPILQSAYKLFVMLVNIFLNIILIKLYGLVGVAIATAISFVVGAVILAILNFGLTRTK